MNKQCPVCRQRNGERNFSAYESHGRFQKSGGKRFQYYKCTNCGSLFHAEKITNNFYKAYYPEQYYDDEPSGLSKVLTQFSNYKKRKLVESSSKDRQLSILDVGCGNGLFLKSLPNRYKKHGVEIDRKAASVAQASGAEIFVGDFTNMQISKKFDVIVSWHVIEHIVNPNAFMKKVSELLKPEGTFLCSTPNAHCLGMHFGKTDWFHLDAPRHITLFNKRSLKLIAENNGLVCERIISNYWEFPLDTFWSLKSTLLSIPMILMYPFMKRADEECITIICRKK